MKEKEEQRLIELKKQEKELRNKGFKYVNSTSEGDFVFTVQVQTPKRLTKEQRELLTQLARTMNEQPPVKKKGIFG